MHADLLATSAYYLDPLRPLLLAMIAAEGGEQAFIRAIQCSRPDVTTFGMALSIGCKTVRNRLHAAMRAGIPVFTLAKKVGVDPWTDEANPRCLVVTPQFVDYLASTWAPLHVDNDPTNLNANWPKNVKTIYAKQLDLEPGTWEGGAL